MSDLFRIVFCNMYYIQGYSLGNTFVKNIRIYNETIVYNSI